MFRSLLILVSLFCFASVSLGQDTGKNPSSISLHVGGAEKKDGAFAPNLSRAYTKAKAEKKPFVLIFGSEGADAFVRLRRDVFEKASFARYGERAVFAYADPERDDAFGNVRAKMKELGINAFPMLCVLDAENMQEIERLTGRWDEAIYVAKLNAALENFETYRKTGSYQFGENAADVFHPHWLRKQIAKLPEGDLDLQAKLTLDRLHAVLLQSDSRTTLNPQSVSADVREYGAILQGSREKHSIRMEVSDSSITIRRYLARVRPEQVTAEAMRKVLQTKIRSGAAYGCSGEPSQFGLSLTIDRDTTVERFIQKVRAFVEDSDDAVMQVLPLLSAVGR
ncbi:MAG: thioredoxin family protein [Gemmataceae bacterium]|nr:thioredoxin family protein [Gemmataceae bacterium]